MKSIYAMIEIRRYLSQTEKGLTLFYKVLLGEAPEMPEERTTQPESNSDNDKYAHLLTT